MKVMHEIKEPDSQLCTTTCSRRGDVLMNVNDMDYGLRRGSPERSPTTCCYDNFTKLHDDEKSRCYYEKNYVEKKKNSWSWTRSRSTTTWCYGEADASARDDRAVQDLRQAVAPVQGPEEVDAGGCKDAADEIMISVNKFKNNNATPTSTTSR